MSFKKIKKFYAYVKEELEALKQLDSCLNMVIRFKMLKEELWKFQKNIKNDLIKSSNYKFYES